MEKLVIPKDCVLQGERITIRYEGDISIENDLVPLSVKSDAGDIAFSPQSKKATCSHLSAENGCLSVRADSLSAEFLSGMTGKLEIGQLEVTQALQFSQHFDFNGVTVVAPEVHSGSLVMVAIEQSEIQSLEVDGDVDLTLGRGTFGTIKGKSVRIRAEASVECERITAEEGVTIESGNISVKMIDAPRFEAAPDVKGVVILATCDDVRAEGVRGFIKPEEFKMFSQQIPLALRGGKNDSSDEAGQPQPAETVVASAVEQVPSEEVSTRPLDLVTEDVEEGEEIQASAEDEAEDEDLAESTTDANRVDQAPGVEAAEAFVPADSLVEESVDQEAEQIVGGFEEISEQKPSMESGSETPAEPEPEPEVVENEEEPDLDTPAPVIDDDEYLTREISSMPPQMMAQTEQAPELEEPESAAEDDVEPAVPSEDIDELPEITDFGDFPELAEESRETEQSQEIDDMEFEILGGSDDDDEFAEFDEIVPTEDDIFDEVQAEPIVDESFKSEPLPDDPEIDKTTDLEAEVSESAAEAFGPGGLVTGQIDELQRPALNGLDALGAEDETGKEDQFVEDLRRILTRIQECFPDENYPKFISQIETYLDERRFSILRKKRNKEAVLSSFDRLDHSRISQLAREFYRTMADYFGDEG